MLGIQYSVWNSFYTGPFGILIVDSFILFLFSGAPRVNLPSSDSLYSSIVLASTLVHGSYKPECVSALG